MPTACTCGASLPEDARFCHRCGKPQRDELPEREPEPRVTIVAPPVITAAREPAAGMTFSNPMVLRTSLLVASLTTVLEMIPFVGFVAPIIGGFASVSLYQRRTGQTLTSSEGAKLGWLTSIFNTLMFTVWVSLLFAVSGAGFFDNVREQVRLQATNPAQQQALQMMNDPIVLGVMVLFAWLFLFGFCSALYIAGGALGARFYRPKTS